MSSSIEIDNRGTAEVPYGYVYLQDTRVGFAKDGGVWETWGWPVTDAQILAATAKLDEAMPGWNEPKDAA
jgi:hypothetical protein